MIKISKAIVIAILVTSGAAQAGQKALRATEMNSANWTDFSKGKIKGALIEFREGDEIPVAIEAKGDLFETKRNTPTYISVKRNFWVQLNQNDIEMSLDGIHFKSLQKSVSGSVAIGAGSGEEGGLGNFLSLLFEAKLK